MGVEQAGRWTGDQAGRWDIGYSRGQSDGHELVSGQANWLVDSVRCCAVGHWMGGQVNGHWMGRYRRRNKLIKNNNKRIKLFIFSV